MVPGQAPADRFGRPEKTKGGSESLGADIAREVLVQGLAEGFGTEGLLQVLGPGGVLVGLAHGGGFSRVRARVKSRPAAVA